MGFIEEIAPLIIKYAPQYGIKVVSPIIAQAILESASGTSNKVMVKDDKGNVEWRHNYFGLKWRDKRMAISNDHFEEVTSEQRKDGTYYQKVDSFCKFKSMEDCVIGYFQWTNIPTYANLKGVTDPRTYLINIKADNYASSINYVDNVMNVVNKYNLTRFDKMIGQDEELNIEHFGGSKWLTWRNGRPKEYIVIHYTAGTTSRPGSSRNVANGWMRSLKDASADFVVDDQIIVQYNDNLDDVYSHHCGSNKHNTKGGSMYGKVLNSNSIGIEMCSNNITGKITDANDNNWFFTEATLDNAIKLCKYLMKKYNIPPENVYRHYDVSGKKCPGVVGWNEDTINSEQWSKFKKALGGDYVKPVPVVKFPYIVTVTADELNVRTDAGVKYPITTVIHKNEKYTIVDEKNGWGKLKSGAGWINLNYTSR